MKYNLVNFCEFDKYAVKSYCAIHGVDKNLNLGDITKVNKLPKCDFLTYGFPCQDISTAGLQAGIKQGTRSGLLFEVERLLDNAEYKPKFLLMENVKNLVGENHKISFEKWLERLDELGYVNYWKVLNSKDYGIPQNRERVFCLSVRKDINNGFEFPQKQTLKLCLRDIIEEKVDEKFYLSDVVLKNIEVRNKRHKEKGNGFICEPKTNEDIANCLRANAAFNQSTDNCIQVGNVSSSVFDKMHESSRRVYSTDGISPTLNTCGGGNLEAKIQIAVFQQSISNTLTTVLKDNYCIQGPCTRKLTPLEYWRLQGFDDESFYKAQAVNSNSQLYKQAGNSITVDVLVAIYKQMQKYYLNDFTGGIDVVTLFSGIGAFEKAFERTN